MRECNVLEACFWHPGMFLHFPQKTAQKAVVPQRVFRQKRYTYALPYHLVDSLTVSVALGIPAEQTFLDYFNFSTKIVTVKPILTQRKDLLYQGGLVLKKKLLRRNHFLINNRDGFTFSGPYIFNS